MATQIKLKDVDAAFVFRAVGTEEALLPKHQPDEQLSGPALKVAVCVFALHDEEIHNLILAKMKSH